MTLMARSEAFTANKCVEIFLGDHVNTNTAKSLRFQHKFMAHFGFQNTCNEQDRTLLTCFREMLGSNLGRETD